MELAPAAVEPTDIRLLRAQRAAFYPRAGWLCAFYLNMCVLWAYQSLVSAQNFYLARYPSANLSFWGTVAVGVAMVAGQLANMLLSFPVRFRSV